MPVDKKLALVQQFTYQLGDRGASQVCEFVNGYPRKWPEIADHSLNYSLVSFNFRLRMLHVTSSVTIGEFWRILALNCSESEFRSVIRQTLSLQLSNLRKFTARLQQKSTADYTSCHGYCNLKTIDRVPGFSL